MRRLSFPIALASFLILACDNSTEGDGAGAGGGGGSDCYGPVWTEACTDCDESFWSEACGCFQEFPAVEVECTCQCAGQAVVVVGESCEATFRDQPCDPSGVGGSGGAMGSGGAGGSGGGAGGEAPEPRFTECVGTKFEGGSCGP